MWKKLWEFLRTNKPKIGGVLVAITIYALAKEWITIKESVLVTGILTAAGFIISKDENKHSTSEQVKKADEKEWKK